MPRDTAHGRVSKQNGFSSSSLVHTGTDSYALAATCHLLDDANVCVKMANCFRSATHIATTKWQ